LNANILGQLNCVFDLHSTLKRIINQLINLKYLANNPIQNVLHSTAHRPVDAPQRETEGEKIQNLFASNFSQMQNILDLIS
jgi:hypothetical protein